MNFSCPQCGHELPTPPREEKLLACAACGTLSFLEDAVARAAGTSGPMQDVPSLFAIGQQSRLLGQTYQIHGQIRFDYGAGFWDEFWVSDDAGASYWISQDEGDISLEQPLSAQALRPLKQPKLDQLTVGAPHPGSQKWIVSEIGLATCLAMRGALPERTQIGQQHAYAHLWRADGKFITLEQSAGDGVEGHVGTWVDPFEVVG